MLIYHKKVLLKGMVNLRILMISSSFYPKIDGSIRVVYDLSRKLVDRGHDVYLLTRRLPGTSPIEIVDGIYVVRVGPSGATLFDRSLFSLRQGLEVLKILKSRYFDVIHSHGCAPGVAGIVGKCFRKVPVVISFHGHQLLWPKSVRWKGKTALKLEIWLERTIVRRADFIVAQSIGIKNFFINLFGSEISEKIKIIPNGVDLDTFDAQITQREVEMPSPMILSVGTLARVKGFDILIKAMPMVLRKYPQAKFIIVGEGPQKSYFHTLAKRLGVEDSLVLTGQAIGSRLKHFYRMASVVVLPSYSEFFGLVVLEAMAMCKPVISTKVLGPSDIIINGENGLLTEPGDSKKLADAIIHLLSDQELAKNIVFRGRRTVKEKYDLNVVVEQHERLYDSVA